MTNELLNTTDAMVWAAEFCRTFNGYIVAPEKRLTPDPRLVIDEGTMVTWFANAIETGRANPDSSALMRILIGERFDLYNNNAEFHHAINWMLTAIPAGVEAIAKQCEQQDIEDAERVRVLEYGELVDDEGARLIERAVDAARGDAHDG